ncbi:MAG: hypothetical protein CXZ00_12465 [Acidobacteria bacterium]|nr:MAG: hypothetical protein CXZ00_12465 [Acidobacteriota bacterium]
MMQQKSPGSSQGAAREKPIIERRAFARLELPATAFALDVNGNDLGRVVETSGGGLMLRPASPWARLALTKDQQLVITVVEPASDNKTELNVEVRYLTLDSIGLRFL